MTKIEPYQNSIMDALMDPNTIGLQFGGTRGPIHYFTQSQESSSKMTPKAQARLDDLVDKLTRAHEANPSAASTIMADAERLAWRTIQRGDVPDDMERVELAQTNGPVVEFTGTLLRREEYQRTSDDSVFAAELWSTKGGNWVAVWESDGHVSAKRVDAGDVMAAMDFWQWGSVARTLAKKMKWDLRVEIE